MQTENEATGPRGNPLADLEVEAVRASLTNRMFGRAEAPPRIGRFEIERKLGSGGLGVVYAARDPNLDRRVAVKLVRPDRVDGASGALEQTRLWREAKALAKLAHPNVVHVYEVGTHDDQVFVAMQLVEGGSLREWLEAARDWKTVLRVFLGAGRGLAAAHGVGVVHRDFKPDNVLVDEEGRPYVVDFGLARSSELARTLETLPTQRVQVGEALSTTLTKTGRVVGTPAYMAPEQYRGERADERTDVFSFCVALFEGLYGKRPFVGDDLSTIMRAVQRGALVGTPAESRVPARLHRVLARGLAHEPAHRYPDMATLLADLDAAQRSRTSWWLGATGGLALAGGAAFWMSGPAADPPKCRDSATTLAELWSSARAEALRLEYSQMEVPYADAAAAAVVSALDSYAAEWVDARDRACEETHVAGTQSTQLLDARMQCYARRLGELSATVEVLSSPDPKIVENAVSVAQSLSPLTDCDRERVKLGTQPPDAAIAADVETLRSELDHVRALDRVGSYEAAVATGERILSRAESLDYKPLLAEVNLAVAHAYAESGHDPEAKVALDEAALLAEAAGEDEMLAKALAGLVDHVGRSGGEPEQAQAVARRAQAVIERLGGDAFLTSELDSAVGLMHLRAGEFEQAKELFERAATAKAELFGDRNLTVARALHNRAIAQYQLGDFSEAHQTAKQAHAIKLAALGPDHTDVGRSLAMVANCEERLADFEAGLEHQTEALRIYEGALGPDSPRVADALLSLGNLHGDLGRHVEAVPLYERAVAIYEQSYGPDHPKTSHPLQSLGNLHEARGEYEKARPHLERALGIIDAKFDDPHPELAIVLVNLANVDVGQGRVDVALERYARAEKNAEATIGADHPIMEHVLTGKGLALVEAGRAGQALAPLERALELRTARKGDPVELALTQFALGRALAASGQTGPRARPLVTQARAVYVESGDAGRHQLANVDAWLAEHPE